MKINRLSEYMAYVEELPPEFSLSRGQPKDYPLRPSALRLDDNGNRKYSKKSIIYFLEQFKINSYQYMENPWDIKNDIEWMLYAQHYGIPTKLMDFTVSHITSLLFSVEKSFQDDNNDDAVVFFLNPAALNNKHKNRSQIINVHGDSAVNSNDHCGPYVIQGRKLNSRINAQKGLFVVFQDDDGPLEELVDDSILRKVIINGMYKKNILSSLYSMGITFTHVYPELASVAKDIILQQDIMEFLEDGRDGE